ncbi:6-phosphogluconolactonase [bioreactor metagenome]|uniref:6-phosphogluconolactonase n=1 Tax=bioreactor metagenome TaxID=1076179 RepID=A0A645BYU4_9ZZZZ
MTLYPFTAAGNIDLDKAYGFKVEPAGSGPRHLVFNSRGDRAYLVNELGNTVIVLGYAAGRLEFMQLLPTLPADCRKDSKASAIRLSPDGRFLYASNRGYDSVAIYAVNPGDGTLEFRELVESGGSSPRDINFLPGGKTFAAANEFSGRVAFFDFDAATGKLTPSGRIAVMSRPLAIFW